VLSHLDLFSALADAALIATGSYYMVATLPFTFLAIYYLQKVYLRTSRQLRILELESRSPVYALFLETLEGLVTIRGFGWQTAMTEENIRRLDKSQVPYYLMFCIQRWLALVLDLMVAGLAVAVVTLATLLSYSTTPGLLGVSLNAILGRRKNIYVRL
jgi:ATP-binding cassette subfamily C (CFTR/MRP) protein 1